jgi:16S rRNA processing protein RimM
MLLVVGVVVRAHGVRGEVVVDVRTDEPEQRFVPGSVLQTDPGPFARVRPAGAWRPPPTLTIETLRPHQGRLLVTFDGIYDRNLAEELRGTALCVDSAEVPDPDDPDEFHDHQLVGLAVVTAAGERIGEVARVDHGAGHDMLVVRRDGGANALVPFVSAIVPEVDLAGGRIVVTPPEGLFDL